MRRVSLFLSLAIIVLSGQVSFAQSNKQMIDSLQQRIEELQLEVDTATIILGLKGQIDFLERELIQAMDSAAIWSVSKPMFQGGDGNAFSAWVNQHVKAQFDENNQPLEGKVTLRFVVSETGEVTDVEVLRGAHPKLDQEAVRVISSSPRWTPAISNGKPVRVAYTFPLVFQTR